MENVTRILGTQYYRPPTPHPSRWEDDFRRMKEAGLNTVQLWAVWGWIEPEPDRFVFDDYDRLMEIAHGQDIRVVISTITDIQPFWMPRLYPNAHMVNQHGARVIGTPRQECLPGLTPGLCTDWEEIRARSMRFMRELATHYKDAPALLAWDCWNENRWCVNCDDWVCHCEASIKSFHAFLVQRYETLEGLGEAWGRRIISWEDVLPPKAVGQVNPPILDFERWLIQRARETAAWRYQALKEGDPHHPIAAHAPCSVTRERSPTEEEPPFARGNDFDNAAELDAFGTSTFPAWWKSDPADIGVLLEVTRSVSKPRPFWLSELQGGAFNQGFEYGLDVSGPLQQFWTWSAYARGAKAVLYWCWRDEVWGMESGGYGIVGQDGHADDRVKQLRATSRLLSEHAGELDAYEPDAATVGVVFDSDSVLLAANSRRGNADAATFSVNGTLKALERCHLPYDLLDGRNLVIRDSIRLLVLPAAFCLKPRAAEAIAGFMARGGWVFAEAGTGMFAENGFYHDRAAERPLVGKLGIGQTRRRNSRVDASCTVPADTWGPHAEIRLRGAIWSLALEAPSTGRVLARDDQDDPMLIEVPVGDGGLVLSGTFPAHPYYDERYEGYETLLRALASHSKAEPSWRVTIDNESAGVSVRTGRAGKKRLFFLLNGNETSEVKVIPHDAATSEAREWVTGRTLKAGPDNSFSLEVPGPGYRVLEWPLSGT